MTSSLVGSEMCIRDRVVKVSKKTSQDDGNDAIQKAASTPTQCNITCEEPVSYTHLTLPTICSV
eukprot:5072831-Prorocentrum_lima.AAC.1